MCLKMFRVSSFLRKIAGAWSGGGGTEILLKNILICRLLIVFYFFRDVDKFKNMHTFLEGVFALILVMS